MNTRLRARVIRRIVACVLLASLAGGARATTVILDIDGQHQRASALCWAATSAMAVNSFHITGGQVTQAQLAAFAERGIETRADYEKASPKSKDYVDKHVLFCDADISECDGRRYPLLPGLTFTMGSEGKALKWADLRKQIDDKRPVLFTWVYLKTRLRAELEHQLIVIGYREEGGAKQLLVWDPMPVKNPLKVVANSVIRASTQQWISYDMYRNPRVHAGRKARHGFTTYNLAVEATHISLPVPVLTDTLRGVSLDPAVSFGDALHEAETELRRLETELNATTTPARRIGTPMPIVALEDGDLIEERDPTSLLTASTSTLLVPVLKDSRVEDAFLLIRVDGYWKRGGYISLGVAQELLEQRDRSAHALQVPPGEFFAISMPQRATFFAAYGYREAAQLIPIATDPRIGAYAGQPRLAAEQFGDLIRRILNVRTEDGQSTNRPTGPPARD